MLDELLIIVNEGQIEELNQIPNLQEVNVEVMGLNRNNTEGPDGMTVDFFPDAWDIIGNYVHQMVVDFFYGYKLQKFITHTNFVLLPKKLVVNTFSDMRSISLSNLLNNIFS